jgi:hypothetical protein
MGRGKLAQLKFMNIALVKYSLWVSGSRAHAVLVELYSNSRDEFSRRVYPETYVNVAPAQ